MRAARARLPPHHLSSLGSTLAAPILTDTTRTYGGVPTRVLEARGDGPAVVLVHGFSDSADSWRAVLAALELDGHRAVAVDLPGHGRAAQLGHGPVAAQLTAFLAAVLRDHRVDGIPPVVVGNSLGGYLALAAAAEPGATSGVVALAPAGFGSRRLLLSGAHLSRIIGSRSETVRVSPVLARWFAARGVSRLMVHERAGSETALRTYADQFRTHDDVRRVLTNAHRIAGELVLRTAEIPHVDEPVVVAWGDRDRLLPAALAAHVAGCFPRGSYEILHGVGHCIHIEAPDSVAALAAGLVRAH